MINLTRTKRIGRATETCGSRRAQPKGEHCLCAAVLGVAAFVVARPFIEAGRRHLHLRGHLNRHPPEAR